MYTLESDIPPNSNTHTAFAVTLNDEREWSIYLVTDCGSVSYINDNIIYI